MSELFPSAQWDLCGALKAATTVTQSHAVPGGPRYYTCGALTPPRLLHDVVTCVVDPTTQDSLRYPSPYNPFVCTRAIAALGGSARWNSTQRAQSPPCPRVPETELTWRCEFTLHAHRGLYLVLSQSHRWLRTARALPDRGPDQFRCAEGGRPAPLPWSYHGFRAARGGLRAGGPTPGRSSHGSYDATCEGVEGLRRGLVRHRLEPPQGCGRPPISGPICFTYGSEVEQSLSPVRETAGSRRLLLLPPGGEAGTIELEQAPTMFRVI